MEDKLLTTEELAERWSVNPLTLEGWRIKKKGPAFVKLGKGSSALVRYRMTDVVKYEEQMLKEAT